MATASTGCGYPDFTFAGTGGTGGALTCSGVHQAAGCCENVLKAVCTNHTCPTGLACAPIPGTSAEGCYAGTLHYCDPTSMSLVSQMCGTGMLCTWDENHLYYGCGAPPVLADPSGMTPITCGP